VQDVADVKDKTRRVDCVENPSTVRGAGCHVISRSARPLTSNNAAGTCVDDDDSLLLLLPQSKRDSNADWFRNVVIEHPRTQSLAAGR